MSEEIIKISCPECKNSRQGTYKELFGELANLRLLPKIVCKQCQVVLELEFVPEVIKGVKERDGKQES